MHHCQTIKQIAANVKSVLIINQNREGVRFCIFLILSICQKAFWLLPERAFAHRFSFLGDPPQLPRILNF